DKVWDKVSGRWRHGGPRNSPTAVHQTLGTPMGHPWAEAVVSTTPSSGRPVRPRGRQRDRRIQGRLDSENDRGTATAGGVRPGGNTGANAKRTIDHIVLPGIGDCG